MARDHGPKRPAELRPSEVTQILDRWRTGSREAMEELFTLLYRELHRRARYRLGRERSDHTLQPTAVVNELFLKMSRQREVPRNREHFLATASILMEHILISYARRRSARPENRRITLSEEILGPGKNHPLLDDLADALQRLDECLPRASLVLYLMVFEGGTQKEVGDSLQITERTVRRDWKLAKAFLHRELTRS